MSAKTTHPLNEMQKMAALIQAETGETQEQIAEKIGYSRPHFNTKLSNNDKGLRERFKSHYPEVFKQNVRETEHPIKLEDYIQALKGQVTLAEGRIRQAEDNLRDIRENNDFLRDMMRTKITSIEVSLVRMEESQDTGLSMIKGGLSQVERVAAVVQNIPLELVQSETNTITAGTSKALKQKGKVGYSQGKGS